MKRQVIVHIQSASKEQSLNQIADGEMIERGKHLYIRYPEQDPNMGQTMTTVKVDVSYQVDKPSIKVLRHGDIQSEQTFDLNQRWAGFYVSPHLRMELVTQTHDINIELEDGLGTIHWSYDLYVGEQNMGTYQLKLEIQEGQQS